MLVYLIFNLLSATATAAEQAESIPQTNAPATLAEQICQSYTRINTLSCLVRKTSELEGQPAVTMLSRVFYERPDRLSVENVTPIKRRIIADGERFYLALTGSKKGYSVPLSELTGEWRLMQQSIPATALEHLLRLRGLPEDLLEPLPDLPVRRGYATEKIYVVLACDEQQCLKYVEFFPDRQQGERVAFYQYDNFVQVDRNCWLAASQRAELVVAGDVLRETKRFDNLQVNHPIAAGMFDATAFFKGVKFVSDFPDMDEE